MPGNSRPPPGQAVAQLVWVNGRAQNPDRFVKAGVYVQQAE